MYRKVSNLPSLSESIIDRIFVVRLCPECARNQGFARSLLHDPAIQDWMLVDFFKVCDLYILSDSPGSTLASVAAAVRCREENCHCGTWRLLGEDAILNLLRAVIDYKFIAVPEVKRSVSRLPRNRALGLDLLLSFALRTAATGAYRRTDVEDILKNFRDLEHRTIVLEAFENILEQFEPLLRLQVEKHSRNTREGALESVHEFGRELIMRILEPAFHVPANQGSSLLVREQMDYVMRIFSSREQSGEKVKTRKVRFLTAENKVTQG